MMNDTDDVGAYELDRGVRHLRPRKGPPRVKKGRLEPPFQLVDTAFQNMGFPLHGVNVARLNRAHEFTKAREIKDFQAALTSTPLFDKLAMGPTTYDDHAWYAALWFVPLGIHEDSGHGVVILLPRTSRRNFRQARTRLVRPCSVYINSRMVTPQLAQVVVDMVVHALEAYTPKSPAT